MAKQTAVSEGLVQLDPSLILADSNSRYGLKRLRIDSLKQSILEQNGVMVPVEVEPLATPTNGHMYRLTAGFYRHEAVTELNKEGAGLALPAQIKSIGDESVRLRRQLAENMERENQSPMDQAIAIKRLEDIGTPKIEIRKMFSVPGGRKGLAMEMASNSFINMRLSFLDFPKAIQEKIHDGRVGVAAAYQLAKVPKEKWDEILESAEADRLSQFDKEKKEEEKFLESERKASEAKQKEVEAQTALEAAKVKAAEVKAAAQAKLDRLKEVHAAMVDAKGKDEKAKAKEAYEAAEVEAKEAEKSIETVGKEVEKVEGQSLRAAKAVVAANERLAAARKVSAATKAKAKTPVGPEAVKKAAAKASGESGFVALNAAQMRQVLVDKSKPGVFPKVQAIMIAIKECFDGVTTEAQMYSKLGVLTGEKLPTKADLKKAAAEKS